MTTKRQFEEYSTNAVHMMHEGIRHHVALEDLLLGEGKPTPYGMRTLADHRVMGDELERELTLRGEKFDPIKW